MIGALIYKDVMMLWKSSKTLLLVMIPFLLAAAISPGNLFFILYPAVALCTFSLTSISHDQRCGWDRCAGTLPYGRRNVVTAKYLLAVLSMAAAGVLYTLASLVSWALHGPWSRMTDWVFTLEMLLLVATFNITVMLPVALRFGLEKARILYILFICGGTVFITMYLPIPGLVIPDGLRGVGMALSLPLLCAVLWVISWALSQRIYRNKEL